MDTPGPYPAGWVQQGALSFSAEKQKFYLGHEWSPLQRHIQAKARASSFHWFHQHVHFWHTQEIETCFWHDFNHAFCQQVRTHKDDSPVLWGHTDTPCIFQASSPSCQGNSIKKIHEYNWQACKLTELKKGHWQCLWYTVYMWSHIQKKCALITDIFTIWILPNKSHRGQVGEFVQEHCHVHYLQMQFLLNVHCNWISASRTL